MTTTSSTLLPSTPRRRLCTRGLTATTVAGLVLLTSAPAHAARLTYDSANRLVRLDDDDVSISYQYDGAGNLVRTCRFPTTGESSCDRLVVNDQAKHARVVAQLSEGATAPDEIYAYGPRGVIAARHGDQTLVSMPDHLGSIRGWVDRDSGEVAGRLAYDAFGRSRARVGTTAAIGYAGEWTSSDDTQWLRARMYLPELGRFAQRDTYEGHGRDPASLNRYTYVHNNPLRNVDPSGNIAITGSLVVGVLSFVLSTAFLWNELDQPAQAPWDAEDIHRDMPVWQKGVIAVSMELAGIGLAEYVVMPLLRGSMRLASAGSMKIADLTGLSGKPQSYMRRLYGRSAKFVKSPSKVASPPPQVFGDCVLCSIETIFRHSNTPLPISPVATRVRNSKYILFNREAGIGWMDEKKILKQFYKNPSIELKPFVKANGGTLQKRTKDLMGMLKSSHGSTDLWQGLRYHEIATGSGAHAITAYQSSAMASATKPSMIVYDSAIGKYIKVDIGEFLSIVEIDSWTRVTRISPPTP